MKAADIEKVLHELGCAKVMPVGMGKIKASCPLAVWRHRSGRDEHPSFVVWAEDDEPSAYYCSGCKIRGSSMLSLVWRVVEASKRDLSKLVEFVGKADGEKKPFDRLESTEYTPSPSRDDEWRPPPERKENRGPPVPESVWTPFGGRVARYFLERGLKEATCRAWGLGDDPRRQRALFAVRDAEGVLWGVTGRTYAITCRCGFKFSDEIECPHCGWWRGPKYLHTKGFKKEYVLYGEHVLDRAIRVGYVVEGHIDAPMLWQYGYRNPVAVMGSEPSRQQVDKLVSYFDRLVVVGDGDKAGRKMAAMVDRVLGKRMPVIVKELPDGMDPGGMSEADARRWIGEPLSL